MNDPLESTNDWRPVIARNDRSTELSEERASGHLDTSRESTSVVPRTLINRRSDVDAKEAFLEALRERGFLGRVTSSPADITATKDGETFYFEIKFTNQPSSYFGAATLTEWEAAIRDPGRFWFVTAHRTAEGWVFHDYTPQEFMAFSTIPPFKVFFQIPVGAERAAAPERRSSRSVPLTEARIGQMTDLFRSWRSPDLDEDRRGATPSSPDSVATQIVPKAGESSRRLDLMAFWNGVLPELKARLPLFESVSAPPYPHMTKTDHGITVRLNIKLSNASVWLQIHRSTKLESESVYRRLTLHRSEIEAKLPNEAGWDDRPADQWDSLLIWVRANREYGLDDRDHWREVQKDLVAAAAALIGATGPYLPATRWTTR